MDRRRIEIGSYKTGIKGARCAVLVLTKRWGWIVEEKPDALGWTLVKPYQMDEESTRLLAMF